MSKILAAALMLAGLACTTVLSLTAGWASSGTSCPVGAIVVGPEQKIQDAVGNAGEGAKFCLSAGLYRLQEVTPKNGQAFFGQDGSILSGAREIKEFHRDGNLWVASDQTQKNTSGGSCAEDSPTCNLPDAFFVDDKPLRRVLSREEVSGGRFYLDQSKGLLYFADDPHGHKIEATVARFAFTGKASNVHIEHMIVEKYSNPAQFGAVNGSAGRNWHIESVESRLNSGAGISVGSDSQILGSNVHHNGQLGVRIVGDNIQVRANAIWANNTRGFDMAWEAGGLKVTESKNVQLVGNRVYDNAGTGLWGDINCRDIVYDGNIIEDNDGPGIFHEISFAAVIRNNTLRHNARGERKWYWNAEIQIAASEHVDVYKNTLTVSPGGGAIMLIDQGRSAQGAWTKEYKTKDNYVHQNLVTFEGNGHTGGASDTFSWNANFDIIEKGRNRFDGNVYRVPNHDVIVFPWGRERLSWDDFRKKGQEQEGQLSPY
jgi:hypothetical protein